MDNVNSVFSGSVALLAGNFVGSITDRIADLINTRMYMIRHARLGEIPTSLIEAGISLVFQTGMMASGTNIVITGLPWITEDPGSLALYILGLLTTTNVLKKRLNEINHFVLVGSDYYEYRTEDDKKKKEGGEGMTIPTPAVDDS